MKHVDSTPQGPVLIVGGTGKTGRRVAERLQALKVPVRIGSRSASPSFDWEDPSTWAAALEGVSAAYITYYPDVAMPGAPEAIDAFIKQALAGGVRRLVLLSGRGEHEAQRAEDMLQASGADWTVVRCSWFMQNFDEGVFVESLLAGEVALPVSDTPEPFVDVDDIADVVAAALTDDKHIGQLYELTGPRMLSFAQAVQEIAQAAGREIPFVRIPMQDFAVGAAEQGTPPEIVEFLGYLFTEVLDGRNAHLADGVQRALGREPGDFASYARRTAASGVWNAPL